MSFFVCFLSLALLLFSVTHVIIANDENCTLDCQQGASCEFGEADFSEHVTFENKVLSFHEAKSFMNMHCACPLEWTGLTCNRKFESCDEDNKCYNGGKCIPGILDEYDNEQLFCDCSNAIDKQGYKYVGKYCEHAGMERCDVKNTFCVNGGECNPDFPLSGNPCTCDKQFEGSHCEFMKGTVPKCDLECNNGECVLGILYPNQVHDLAHLFSSQGFKRCECHEGFGGASCNIERTVCGDNHCFHGGECVIKEVGGSEPQYHCDCSTASDGNVRYAGRFCQFVSRNFCSDDFSENGVLFCVNGGTCNADISKECICPDDYYGPSCEFQHLNATVIEVESDDNQFNEKDDDGDGDGGNEVKEDPDEDGDGTADYAECNLLCENGGSCRKGEKDLGILTNVAASAPYLNVTSDSLYQHCVCPVGFVGLSCQYRLEICAAGKHICLHGGMCVPFGENIACDCASASTSASSYFAGASCEHQATTMCTIGSVTVGQPRSFCVNGGTCKRNVTANELESECNCDGEWTGPHCELKRSAVSTSITTPINAVTPTTYSVPASTPSSYQSTSLEGNVGMEIGVVVISILAIVISMSVLALTFTRHRRLRRQRAVESVVEHADNSISFVKRKPFRDPEEDAMSVSLASDKTDHLQVYIGPPIDEDGHELHNVII